MIGARIAMLRRSSRLSQQELAHMLGVSASAVGMYEQGRREPPCQILLALARIFHVSVDFLLTGEAQAPQDLDRLQSVYEHVAQSLNGRLVLRRENGEEHLLGERELALLTAALLGLGEDSPTQKTASKYQY